MHDIRLKDLPPPPPGRYGWPWTAESPQVTHAMPDGAPWPRISIITPSFNQGQYIEETIRSVLLQGYADLEYLIIDGGSTDGSLDIIHKYEPWLARWVSEPDRGQSDAINKGIRMATGEIINWINSDDCLLQSALRTVAQIYSPSKDSMVICAGIDFHESSQREHIVIPRQVSVQDIVRFWEGWFDWLQPSIFFSRDKFFLVGGLDETLNFSMDIDLYCRLMQTVPVVFTSTPVSKFRRHLTAKTRSRYHDMILEHIRVCARYKGTLTRQEENEYQDQVIRFILRRAKRLLLDGEVRTSVRYVMNSLRWSLLRTWLLLGSLSLSRLR
jgi:glycosyltransferase involved in cell wall biosynthesis